MKKSEIRQERILQYMKDTINGRGFPPTVREICADLEIKSTSTVFKDLNALEEKGLIRKDPSKPRALVVVGMDRGTPAPEAMPEIDDTNITLIPIIGDVAAGTPILSEQNIDQYVPFPSQFLGNGKNFILAVHGNSMVDVGICDNDFIIVREDHEAQNGDIVVAMIEGDYEYESTVKRFYREKDHIRLHPENSEMEDIIVPDCKIVGKVEGVYRHIG